MNGSPSVRTRRQAAEAAKQANEQPEPNGHLNGSAEPPALVEKSEPQENIFLFYPNVIGKRHSFECLICMLTYVSGYSRIILAVASLYYMPLHPRTCSILYSISCLLDALDGFAARHFEQSTQFGSVLDMVTDRCTTSCLLVFLSSAWPRWALLFQGLISLDLASHYIHMYATLTMAGSGKSHKQVSESRSRLLHLYYTDRVGLEFDCGLAHVKYIQNVLFTVCALNELFFIALYLLSFSSPTLSPSLLPVDDKPGASVQPGSPSHPALSLLVAPGSAYAMELARANKMDSWWPWVLAGVSSPVMAFKQVLNAIQLVKASRWLAEGDMENRRRQGLPKKKK